MLFFMSADEPEFEYSGKKKGDSIRTYTGRSGIIFCPGGMAQNFLFRTACHCPPADRLFVGCGTAAENYRDRRFYYEKRFKWCG